MRNTSPNLFITYLSRKSCFDCVWFSLGFQNGFCWSWKWVYETSRVLYLFGLVIAGYSVKMFGFTRLVDLSSKVQVFLVLQVRRVATPAHRVAMWVWSKCIRGLVVHRVAIPSPRAAIRGQSVFSRRDTRPSRRDPCIDRVAILPSRVASFSAVLVRNFFV